MMTHDAETRARLADLWRLNRARYLAAGWRLSTYLALPRLATLTALFPTDPPEWAPDAGHLMLLPAQQAVQARIDAERTPPRRRPVGTIHVPDLRPTIVAQRKTHKVGSNRIRPRPLVLRNGFWIEPLAHHAFGPRRHYPPRAGQEA